MVVIKAYSYIWNFCYYGQENHRLQQQFGSQQHPNMASPYWTDGCYYDAQQIPLIKAATSLSSKAAALIRGFLPPSQHPIITPTKSQRLLVATTTIKAKLQKTLSCIFPPNSNAEILASASLSPPNSEYSLHLPQHNQRTIRATLNQQQRRKTERWRNRAE